MGPFPALAAARATSSSDALVLIGFDGANWQNTAQRLDIRTGQTSPIGSLPITQPWICILGTDSVLTVDGTTLQGLGRARCCGLRTRWWLPVPADRQDRGPQR